MSTSSRRASRRALHRAGRAFALLACLSCLPLPAAAQQDSVRVSESTLNDAAAAIGTIPFDFVPPPLEVQVPWPEFVGPFFVGFTTRSFVVCQGLAQTVVEALSFDIRAQEVDVAARFKGRWCGVNVATPVTGSADILINDAGNQLWVMVDTEPIAPRVSFQLPWWLGGGTARLDVPFDVDVGRAVTLGPVPLGRSEIRFHTAKGPRTLNLSTRNIELTQGNGFIELSGEVHPW